MASQLVEIYSQANILLAYTPKCYQKTVTYDFASSKPTSSGPLHYATCPLSINPPL